MSLLIDTHADAIAPVPDLAEYALHRTADPATFEGVPVPGLAARFYRRDEPGTGRLHSVGRYWLRGRELLMAWGYVDEEHCRFSSVRDERTGWGAVTSGCPIVELVRDGDGHVVGFAVQAADGSWIGDATPDAIGHLPGTSAGCATSGGR
ncbi:MAG: hypothetical protein HOV79_26700 [Hamadaea sp.]|nr:hypothetical protein [Hamadaea sp.]